MNPCVRGRYADPTYTHLELEATRWLDGFYQLEHLFNTRYWVLQLTQGAASEALRLAAITHDAERFFPGGPSGTPDAGFDDPDYLFAHSIRSADIIEKWLREQGPEGGEPFIRQVRRLVLRHEIGGGDEADILSAADGLSFLDIFDWLTVDWVRKGIFTPDEARGKLRWSIERIRPPRAIELALPLYERAIATLASWETLDVDLEWRRRLAGDRSYQLGSN
jgi:hypothetical protein